MVSAGLKEVCYVGCIVAKASKRSKNESSKSDKGFYTTAVQRGGPGEYESVRVPKAVGGAAGRTLSSVAALRMQSEARYAETRGRYNLPLAGRTDYEEPSVANTLKRFVSGLEMLGAGGKRVSKPKSRGGAGGVRKK